MFISFKNLYIKLVSHATQQLLSEYNLKPPACHLKSLSVYSCKSNEKKVFFRDFFTLAVMENRGKNVSGRENLSAKRLPEPATATSIA